jgi:hypothetical protein
VKNCPTLKTTNKNLIYKVGWLFEKNVVPFKTSTTLAYLTWFLKYRPKGSMTIFCVCIKDLQSAQLTRELPNSKVLNYLVNHDR